MSRRRFVLRPLLLLLLLLLLHRSSSVDPSERSTVRRLLGRSNQRRMNYCCDGRSRSRLKLLHRTDTKETEHPVVRRSPTPH
uniref:Putative secreted peptide n=1 Tax=Anopheles braziliensis TaxID=58242 RepID=A0A2M3ZNQ2_9DIPT